MSGAKNLTFNVLLTPLCIDMEPQSKNGKMCVPNHSQLVYSLENRWSRVDCGEHSHKHCVLGKMCFNIRFHFFLLFYTTFKEKPSPGKFHDGYRIPGT